MGNIKDETIKGVKWSAIERFSVQGIQFLLGIIMARLLTPSDYGIIGMLAIFMAIAQSFVDSGFSNALIRKLNRKDIDFSTVFFFNVFVGIICYALLFFLSPAIALFFDTPILKDVLRVLAVNLFINSLAVVQRARLTIAVDFKTQAKATVVAVTLSGVLGITLAYCGMGVWALVYQSVANTSINVCLLWLFARWYPKLEFSIESFKEMFSYGSKLLISGLIQTVYSKLSGLAIGKYYTSIDLGYYSRGEQFAALPSDSLNGVLQRVTFPVFSKIQNDDMRLMSVYRKYIKVTSIIMFFFLTLLASISKPLISIVLTDKWLPAVVFLQIFCFDYMFDHICRINLNLLQVKGRSDLFLRLEIIKKTISTFILVISIPFGVMWICLTKIIYTQIAIVINCYYTGKLFNVGYLVQLKDYGKYFLISFVACVPSFLFDYADMNKFVHITIGPLMSVGLYWVFLHNDAIFREILDTVKSKITK